MQRPKRRAGDSAEDDLAAFGMDEEARAALDRASMPHDPEDELLDPDADFVVMPENWPAVSVFLRFSTQWRQSMSGITGLDYTPLMIYLRTKLRGAWEELFDEIQSVEHGALMAMAEKRKQTNGERV